MVQFIRASQRGEYLLDDYLQYLKQSAEKFPAGARDFATASWHYDTRHPQCPHDSWLEEFLVKELSSGDRKQVRWVQINIKCLGAYHDGYFELVYKNVSSYSVSSIVRKAGRGGWLGHGDWLVDELTMTEANLINHEVEFVSADLKITCVDLDYRWTSRRAGRHGN